MLREGADINTESTEGIIIKLRFGPISKLCILLTLALDDHLMPLPGTCQTTIRRLAIYYNCFHFRRLLRNVQLLF